MSLRQTDLVDTGLSRDRSSASTADLPPNHGATPRAASTSRLPVPSGIDPTEIMWSWAIAFGIYHLLALLAFAPWFFSWSGVAVAAVGFFVFGVLGINIGFHRLLTHRGFSCPRWVEHTLAILGVCSLQGSPTFWVAVHRRHHHHPDEQPDPHSPLVNFFWAHMGWLLVEAGVFERLGWNFRYAKDLLNIPFYKSLERNYIRIVLASALAFFAVGFAVMALTGAGTVRAVQFGASLLLWGVVVRTIAVWHVTWSVNSVTHLWGYRNYENDENSRNNVLIAVLAIGEGWHNNHHADQRSAKHGHLWWEIDGSYLTIRLLAALGLVSNIVMPNPRLAAKRRGVARL
jgi:fatty-acid desaturase